MDGSGSSPQHGDGVTASALAIGATAPQAAPRRGGLAGYLQRARVIAPPDGYATLDVGSTPAVVDRFKRLDRLLAACFSGALRLVIVAVSRGDRC
jgi:hypothetical protein